jgi:hypothetical protein
VIEVWYDTRHQFKAIVGDGFLFITVLGILEVVYLILNGMPYPADRKHFLESTHFWGAYSVLIILIVDLVMKILLSITRPK